ncbi:Lysosomal beta glucosidase [Glycine soja]|nr:Lysosomal beta glucosidase [Glycine soja]
MDCVYMNPQEPIEARVKHLLSLMTLKEKIGQMTQIERSVATPSAIKHFSIVSAPHNGRFEKVLVLSSDSADMVDGFQKLALESRLAIPIIYGVDAIHGNSSVYGATRFPHNVGLGATRDYTLCSSKLCLSGQRIGATTSLELRASGFHYTFAPCVAVCEDLRWGRCYESYSENTEIVRKMTSFVLGLQGHPPERQPRGYPFVAGRWNGNKLHGHHFRLNEVLKEKLGFKGFVISEWEEIDECQPYGSDYRHCISTAINAGIDMVMVPFRFEIFIEELMSLVQLGEIPIAGTDDAVERILRVKFAAELFEFPLTDRSLLDVVGGKLHRDLARKTVQKSLVLLKNGKDPSKPFLPLNRNAKRVLVAGTHAHDIGYQCGGWIGTKYESSGQITIGTTILDAVKEAVGNETEVIYEQCPSTDIIERSDVSFAIVVVREGPYAECGGDNSELVIPFNGDGIINLVADKIPTLVILISGRPFLSEQCLLEKIDALVAAWLPVTEAQRITDVIFGDHDFKGQLPMTWFRRVEQLDQPVGVSSCDPLFPLDYGLKYGKENLHD